MRHVVNVDNCFSLEESSRESHDGREDVDALRSNSAEHDKAKSSPSATAAHRDNSETTSDALKPTFWMTDYKQPKRCKKGNCAFQTVSKVSRSLVLTR